ncbi:MAG: cytochrome c class I [Bacteroidetes bacterium]|nr:cytochrome c class I [Bacteroidota bacterium]
MKKFLVFASIVLFVAACSSNSSNTSNDTSTTAETPAAPADITQNPDYKAGLTLVAKYDCLTCHKVSEKLTGPAYVDVANKYADNEANVKMLAEKVIKGGSGVWGQVAMIAHPQVSEADAEQMVKYILLLRTN